jgi:NTE family protein
MSIGALGKDNENEDNDQVILERVFPEGSIVVLNAHDFVKNIDKHSIGTYSWKQKNDNNPLVENLTDENTQNLSFTAPYIEGNRVYNILNFELTTKDINGKKATHNAKVIIKRVQRAMIFQGGASLGAYEAGVFQALVNKLTHDEHAKKGEKRPLFDIVAGTSIGAMIAAIVVSRVTKEDKSWEDNESWIDSANKVIEFWRCQDQPTVADILDTNLAYHFWWDTIHNLSKAFKRSIRESIELYSDMNSSFKRWYDYVMENWFSIDSNFLKDYFIDGWYIPATAESARRYYSAKQFETFGTPNVASGIIPWSIFGKFFDPSDQSNPAPRPDNKHFSYYSLKNTLRRFATFPIRTKPPEPRFLLVSIDVQTGDPVTFDSYSEQTTYHDEQNSISSPDGIEIEHALASGTFPGFFDYPKFKVKVGAPDTDLSNEEHIFWDGGFTSNTPLREVIQAHRDYWHKTRGEDVVPDLEVYIADLWPSELREQPISFDFDFVENRKWGILFSDKTGYDEQVANVITDFIDVAKEFKDLAENKGASAPEITHILNKYGNSRNTEGNPRPYRELLGGRFRLSKVVRIDHKDDGNDVHNKIFDYSGQTIEKLMKYGCRDTLVQMTIQSMKHKVTELAKISGGNESLPEKWKENNSHIQKLEKSLGIIQKSIRIENGYDKTLKEVDKFIIHVESIEAQNANRLLVDELIATAKQFQQQILKVKEV